MKYTDQYSVRLNDRSTSKQAIGGKVYEKTCQPIRSLQSSHMMTLLCITASISKDHQIDLHAIFRLIQLVFLVEIQVEINFRVETLEKRW